MHLYNHLFLDSFLYYFYLLVSTAFLFLVLHTDE